MSTSDPKKSAITDSIPVTLNISDPNILSEIFWKYIFRTGVSKSLFHSSSSGQSPHSSKA